MLSKNKNLLFCGEIPERSSPIKTLAEALVGQGFVCDFSYEIELKSTRRWLQAVRRCDAIVTVAYTGPKSLRVRQLALAAVLGKPIIRWWVGSDALIVLKDSDARRGARQLDKFVKANVVVAPHMVSELRTIPIKSLCIPSVVGDSAFLPADKGSPPRAFLVYLPTDRHTHYCGDLIEEVVKLCPSIKFVIVGDDSHSFTRYTNVQSLGWVDDLSAVWPSVGGLLRITTHDGLPRMVLEALQRGKYVIYSWPYPGCWRANTLDEIVTAIGRFRKVSSPNQEGLEAVSQLLTPPPEERFAELLRRHIEPLSLWRRTMAFASVALLSRRAGLGLYT
jgi:hypothetical protein